MVREDVAKAPSMRGDARVSELGERFLLEYILDTLGGVEGSLLPRGDDAADLEFSGRLVVAVDMFVEKTDKPPAMGWRYVGYKAVVSVLSDLAAKGAEPLYLLTSLGLRGDLLYEEFRELWGGVLECAGEYGVVVLGGDLGEAEDVVVDVTCIGKGERLIPRNGARPGELIAVTGPFGETGAALHALLNNVEADERLLRCFLRPRARVREGKILASTGLVSACTDSSDGLAVSLHHIAEMSNVAMVLHTLPVSEKAREYAYEHGLDLRELALYSGEEYELVFTFRREGLEEVREALNRLGCEVYVVGEVAEGSGVYLTEEGGKMVELKLRGFEHFRP